MIGHWSVSSTNRNQRWLKLYLGHERLATGAISNSVHQPQPFLKKTISFHHQFSATAEANSRNCKQLNSLQTAFDSIRFPYLSQLNSAPQF
jgi:hypothetical protein